MILIQAVLDADSGVPIEQIADAVGHSSTRTTEVVYRHQLRPVTRTAAIAGPAVREQRKDQRRPKLNR